MAEAAVEESVISRFFCHQCSREISGVLPDFICPDCNTGFIEEIQAPQDAPDDSDSDMDDSPSYEVNYANIGDETSNVLLGFTRGSADRRGVRGRERDGSDLRRRYGSVRQRILRNSSRNPRPRQMPHIENLIQDFLVNFTGMGWDALGGRGGHTPIFFLGNPGDYAWGREGLDAIVTQLLNQMDGTGPPPLAKDKIAEIPTVVITEDQVKKCLQCSVCWEDFRQGEPVKKLACDHVYHENCIIPWLELHGTCPICRKSLSDDGQDEQQSGSGSNSIIASSLATLFRPTHDSAASRTPTSSSSSSSSGFSNPTGGGGGGSSTSSRSSHPSNNFNSDMDIE